jgi:transposase
MWKRINDINRYNEEVVYHSRDYRKFTDEHLVNLISENSGLSIKNLAALTDVSIDTISNRIKN